MPDTYVNRFACAVASAPGAAGSIVLGAASTGYRTLGAAQNGQSFTVTLTDGAAWEVRTGCVYTHSTTTLTRGTLEESSTGSAITLGAATIVTGTLSAGTLASVSGAGLSANSFTGTQTITPPVGSSALVVASATQTTSQPVADLAQTWNAAGVTFTGLRLNVTNTASAAASLLLDLQVGGATVWNVDRGGFRLNAQASASATFPWLKGGGFGVDNTVDVIQAGGTYWQFRLNGTGLYNWNASGLNFVNQIGFNSSSSLGPDLVLNRDAANTLAQRNGTAAQEFRVYNTFTDASNYERLDVGWGASANTAVIRTTNAGTGTQRNLHLRSANNMELWAGQFYFNFANGAACVGIVPRSSGVFTLTDSSGSAFDRIQFGSITSSFPALKRSSATLQARLADDSAFTFMQGKLQTDAAAVTETITPTKTLTLYDSTGTAYKVPCL